MRIVYTSHRHLIWDRQEGPQSTRNFRLDGSRCQMGGEAPTRRSSALSSTDHRRATIAEDGQCTGRRVEHVR
jgi:hypothetical protein